MAGYSAATPRGQDRCTLISLTNRPFVSYSGVPLPGSAVSNSGAFENWGGLPLTIELAGSTSLDHTAISCPAATGKPAR